MILKVRNFKGGGAVPIELPLMLFLYTILFLASIEFVMLFWMQSSLATVAKQIALRAATNSDFEPRDARARCEAAANSIESFFPGYSGRVRNDFVAAIAGGKTGTGDFNEINNAGNLRQFLASLGAARPAGFWNSDGAGNQRYGGCYALQNPETRQVIYHVIIHCNNCWPVFLRGLLRRSGWLEARGSSPVILGGANSPLNKSLLSFGPKAFLVCSRRDCDEEATGGLGVPNQNQILNNAAGGGTGQCRTFRPQSNRPTIDQVGIGHRLGVFAVDQWPKARYSKLPPPQPPAPIRQPGSNGADPRPSGITRIANCGSIDPLILVGLRYACLGKDAFGHTLNAGPDTSSPLAANYIGRCDQYFLIKPACNDRALLMKSHVGEITDLDGSNGPCVIRRNNVGSSYTAILPRVDSNDVNSLPWTGPYWKGLEGDIRQQHLDAMKNSPIADKTFPKNTPIDFDKLKSLTNSSQSFKKNANPLEALIPYGAVCDICNPGSPMCGHFGTCRDESNLWEADVALRVQAYFNEPWYGKSIGYAEIKSRYRRDCKEKHCCRDAPPAVLEQYCALRQIKGGNTRSKQCKDSNGNIRGTMVWTYKGVPNRDAKSWTSRSLPRLGNFPLCSTGAVKMLGNRVGECCTADVSEANFGSCPEEKAPMVQLLTPFEQFGDPDRNLGRTGCAQFVTVSGNNISWNSAGVNISKKACGTRERCESGRETNKWCPQRLPRLNGSCLNLDDENYPIGGELICGPAFSYGLMGVPIGSEPTNTMCGGTLGNNINSSPQCGSNSKESQPVFDRQEEIDNRIETILRTTKTECTTCTKCAGTPIYLSLDNSLPIILNKRVCFALDQTRNYLSYKWPKANSKQGFLAIDLNKDGIINDGRELFGNLTGDVYYPNGYTALNVLFDKNNDMLITGQELEGLLLWQDLNEDGISQTKELKSLKDFGIIELDASRYYPEPQAKKFFDTNKEVSAIYYSSKGLKLKNKKLGYSWDIDFKGLNEEKCRLQNNKKQITQNNLKNYWLSLKTFFKGLI